jgi:integrase/recombinase XerD
MSVHSNLPTYLTQQQVTLLFALIRSARDKALFATIYLYGLRVSEACALRRDDVDFERRRIRIRRVKGGNSGEKPMFRRLLRILRRYLASRDDGDPALFAGRQGPLSKRRVQALFVGYALRAGFPETHRHVHILRHSIATHLLDAGEPIDFVKDHLGHRKIESSLVYGRVSDRRRTRTIQRLERSKDLVRPM